METASKRIARQSVLANACRITIKINGVEHHIDYRDVLVHLLFRIVDDMDWDRNPLAHLREYFPDIEWKFYPSPSIERHLPHVLPNSHFIFFFGTGFITATKKAIVSDTCCVISEARFKPLRPCKDRVVINDPLLGEVAISSYNRR